MGDPLFVPPLLVDIDFSVDRSPVNSSGAPDFPNYVTGFGDMYAFSLAAGSSSLLLFGLSPADILVPTPGPPASFGAKGKCIIPYKTRGAAIIGAAQP